MVLKPVHDLAALRDQGYKLEDGDAILQLPRGNAPPGMVGEISSTGVTETDVRAEGTGLWNVVNLGAEGPLEQQRMALDMLLCAKQLSELTLYGNVLTADHDHERWTASAYKEWDVRDSWHCEGSLSITYCSSHPLSILVLEIFVLSSNILEAMGSSSLHIWFAC